MIAFTLALPFPKHKFSSFSRRRQRLYTNDASATPRIASGGAAGAPLRLEERSLHYALSELRQRREIIHGSGQIEVRYSVFLVL
jgi:hypothetical protein